MSKMNYINIGKIIGTFGIKGELKVRSESDFCEYRFRKGAMVYYQTDQTMIPLAIDGSRIHKGNVLIKLEKGDNINDVLHLVGLELYADANDQPPLAEDDYYVDDLIGCDVYNTDQDWLGKITDVLEIPRGLLLEIIDNENRRMLVPFVHDFIQSIENGKMIIQEIEGLR